MRGDFIQVDDCDFQTIVRLKPLSFLCIETSDENYQCWIALNLYKDESLEDVRKRFLRGLKSKGLKGNGGSYGAMRWPGSINYKPERRTISGQPRVRIVFANEGLRVAGLLAAPEAHDYKSYRRAVRSSLKRWPDYERCLEKRPNRSEADAQFVWISLMRGFTEDEIAEKLLDVSDKANEGGKRYIDRTIREVVKWQKKREGAAA
jgi:hypothetical protein